MTAHCMSNPRLQWLGVILQTLAHTGMRIGELLALKWADIDLREGQEAIHILSDSREGFDRRLTKNRQSRSIPINPGLLAMLRRLKSASEGSGVVIRGAQGGRLKSDDVRNALINRVIEPLKKQFPTHAGDSGFEHGRLHSFRHFFISQAANAGTPIKVVQQWVGHKDSEVIDIYFHLSDRDARRHMNALKIVGGDLTDVGQDPAA